MANDSKKPTEKKETHARAHDGGVAPSNCKSETCKRSPEKFGFCMEHYELFMAGVLRGDGKKPLDYEQKLRQFTQKQHRRAA